MTPAELTRHRLLLKLESTLAGREYSDLGLSGLDPLRQEIAGLLRPEGPKRVPPPEEKKRRGNPEWINR